MEGTMENTKVVEEWQTRIADYRASGLTKRQWCEKTGLSVHTLGSWITRINRLDALLETPEWTQVKVVDATSLGSGISVSVGAARIEVEPGFDRSVLAEVMRVAASLC
jgi:hypothetical protein